MLFDEPLTVIDPHLKWQLRRKLKQIHHELKLTLIYVTHDQVEALTFAEQVVVMTRGRAVQIGSASELFERPQHTFVGHFIGSPGMNFLPRAARRGIEVAGRTLARRGRAADRRAHARRAARIRDARRRRTRPARCPASVTQAQDIGTYWLVTARSRRRRRRIAAARAPEPASRPIPKVGEAVWLGDRRRAHLLLRDDEDRWSAGSDA